MRACEERDLPVAAWHSSVGETFLTRTARDLMCDEPYTALLYTTPESIKARR